MYFFVCCLLRLRLEEEWDALQGHCNIQEHAHMQIDTQQWAHHGIDVQPVATIKILWIFLMFLTCAFCLYKKNVVCDQNLSSQLLQQPGNGMTLAYAM